MKIEYFEEFGELSKSLNFLKASKSMCITQPALSNHIKLIEQELGVTLLVRGKGVQPHLTKAGKHFLSGSGRLLAQYESLVSECREIAGSEGQQFTITLPFFVRESSQVLMREIQTFQEAHPDPEVSMVPGSFECNPINDLLAGDTDCCISLLPDASVIDDSLQSVSLVSEEMYVWLDEKSGLARMDSISEQALEGYSLILAASEKSKIIEEWAALALKGKPPIKQVNHYAASFDDYILNAGSVQDVAILPAGYRHYPTFKLRTDRVMKPFEPPLHIDINAFFRKDDRNPAVTAFKEHMLSAFPAA